VQAIFIGVDGGGTKTHVRVEDASGNLIGEGVAGPANVRLSIDQAWNSVYGAIKEALKDSQLALFNKNYDFHVGLGLAGCEVKSAYDHFVERPHPFRTLKLVSDAKTACVGAHGGEDGAIIIVGTGVIGYQIQKNKDRIVGGNGFPHDDDGGGAWLGLQATRLTFQWLDQRSAKSGMVEAIYNNFGKNKNHLIEWANNANASDFATLAPMVIEHYEAQDQDAVALIQKASEVINNIGSTLLKMQETPLDFCMLGSIAAILTPLLNPVLQSKLIPCKANASQGALMMIKEIVAYDETLTA